MSNRDHFNQPQTQHQDAWQHQDRVNKDHINHPNFSSHLGPGGNPISQSQNVKPSGYLQSNFQQHNYIQQQHDIAQRNANKPSQDYPREGQYSNPNVSNYPLSQRHPDLPSTVQRPSQPYTTQNIGLHAKPSLAPRPPQIQIQRSTGSLQAPAQQYSSGSTGQQRSRPQSPNIVSGSSMASPHTIGTSTHPSLSPHYIHSTKPSNYTPLNTPASRPQDQYYDPSRGPSSIPQNHSRPQQYQQSQQHGPGIQHSLAVPSSGQPYGQPMHSASSPSSRAQSPINTNQPLSGGSGTNAGITQQRPTPAQIKQSLQQRSRENLIGQQTQQQSGNDLQESGQNVRSSQIQSKTALSTGMYGGLSTASSSNSTLHSRQQSRENLGQANNQHPPPPQAPHAQKQPSYPERKASRTADIDTYTQPPVPSSSAPGSKHPSRPGSRDQYNPPPSSESQYNSASVRAQSSGGRTHPYANHPIPPQLQQPQLYGTAKSGTAYQNANQIQSTQRHTQQPQPQHASYQNLPRPPPPPTNAGQAPISPSASPTQLKTHQPIETAPQATGLAKLMSKMSSLLGSETKRLEISAPYDFEHPTHVGFVPETGEFTVLSHLHLSNTERLIFFRVCR